MTSRLPPVATVHRLRTHTTKAMQYKYRMLVWVYRQRKGGKYTKMPYFHAHSHLPPYLSSQVSLSHWEVHLGWPEEDISQRVVNTEGP